MDTRSRSAVGTSCPGSDPAALRVITVAVLAGLVVSGIVVIARHGPAGFGRAAPQAMAPPSAPAGLPHAKVAAAPTLKLLSQAARACQTTTYQGVEVFGAGQDVSVVNVWHVPGGVTLAQAVSAAPQWSGVAPHIVTPGSYLGDQALVGSVMLGMSPKLVAMLRSNYRLAAAGWGQVAGRAAREVTVVRPDGRLAAEFWLDKATTLPLRRETFDVQGRIVSDVTFAKLTVGSATMAGPVATAPRQWVAARPARLRAEGWPLPGPLPDGLALLGSREDDTATGRVVDLDYSDGLSLVSVFLQRGHLKSRLTGWSRMALGGSPVYADDAGGQSFVWSARGYVYTLVAAAPAQTVAQVVAALPHDGSPGVLARMRQGLHRLMSWVTP